MKRNKNAGTPLLPRRRDDRDNYDEEEEEQKYHYLSPATDIVTEVSDAGTHTRTVDLRSDIQEPSVAKSNVLSANLRQTIHTPNSMKHNVIRIWILFILLSIGYTINTISVLKSTVSGNQLKQIKIVANYIYVVSSIWLFVSCSVMMVITLYDFYRKKGSGFNTRRYQRVLLSCLFFIGICGHATSLVMPLVFENNDRQIYWEHELLYLLLPVYLYVLCSIYFFHKPSQSIEMIKLTMFSTILFIAPFSRLLMTVFPLPSSLPIVEISIYSSACVATSVLLWLHVICFLEHYRTGLFLKLIIISALAYSLIEYIRHEIDFDKYDDQYRIYYYYTFLGALYIMFSCEIIFINPSRIVIMKSAEYYRSKKSFNPDIAQHESTLRRLNSISRQTSVQSQSVFDNIFTFSTNIGSNSYLRQRKKRKEKIIPAITVDSVIKIFPDFKPCKENKNKYFSEIDIDANNEEEKKRLDDSITAIVPFYNEPAHELLATLRSLYFNFRYIKEKTQGSDGLEFDNTHFNVLLVGDGWFKSDKSTRKYLAQLYNCTTIDDSFNNINYKQNEHNTVILQTKGNQKLCINPFHNTDVRLYLKVTTIIKIDNRKKANSHEWFLGKYGFAEWCKCEYMYFTDAYSTLNKQGLYKMTNHMKEPKNWDVVCCTGRARVYSIEQEDKFEEYLRDDPQKPQQVNPYQQHEEKDIMLNGTKWRSIDIFKGENDEKDAEESDDEDANIAHNIKIGHDHRLSINAHMRACQMFEFEALYGTIGCYLLGGFLPVIPGPCGFYRSEYLLEDKVRAWYFKIINEKNNPDNLNLSLGNMKLAEDRILTITSILNCDVSVRHSLIPDCVFYFDPMPDLTSLMKQRRRWINGSIATIIFVLKKVSFSNWKVGRLRKLYVLLLWYMQLFMFVVLFLSAPILFVIAFKYGLATILDEALVEKNIDTVVDLLMVLAWLIYVAFIYFAQTPGRKPKEDASKFAKFNYYFKAKSVKLMLIISWPFGALTMTGLMMQFGDVIGTIAHPNTLYEKTFDLFVALIGVTFFLQSFVLAPIFSKDIKTLKILLSTGPTYFIYAPFYVIFFFINAIANIHDLSWGTRPDNPVENNSNPKHTTWKILFVLLFFNILIAVIIQYFTQSVYTSMVIFTMLSLPSLFQLFFAFLWLATTRFIDLMRLCIPKKMDYRTEFTNAN